MKKKNVGWHTILASVLQKWLTPVGFTVQYDIALKTETLEADILIIKHDSPLTAEQRYRLADGIRLSKAKHCLAEFKYTESINDPSIIQLLAYFWIYQREQNLKAADIDLFLLLSHTPQQKTLTEMGYNITDEQGIYTSQDGLYRKVTILSLNDLADTPNNIPLKCFAGKKTEQVKAFDAVKSHFLQGMSYELEKVLAGLWSLLIKRGLDMETAELKEITPEYVEQLGKDMIEVFAEERLQNMSTKERLKDLDTDKIISGLSDEKLRQLKNLIKCNRSGIVSHFGYFWLSSVR